MKQVIITIEQQPDSEDHPNGLIKIGVDVAPSLHHATELEEDHATALRDNVMKHLAFLLDSSEDAAGYD